MTGIRYQVLGDWGTSRLRLYLESDATVQAQIDGPGIGSLTGTPQHAFCAALDPWRQQYTIDRVILCGMAGSRNGLADVPYAPSPAGPAEWSARRRVLHIDGLDVAIGAGLCSVSAAGTPDVMRGEETQVFGAMQLHPALSQGRHLLVLPGTHSKWTQLEDGRITTFTTYMTGELFALLRQHSTLLKAGGDTGGEAGGFAAGLARGAARSSGLTATLFETRSAQLMQQRSHAWATQFLSGLLIGNEIHDALTHPSAARSVTLIGDPQLTALYARGLEHARGTCMQLDGAECAIAGLRLLGRCAAQEH